MSSENNHGSEISNKLEEKLIKVMKEISFLELKEDIKLVNDIVITKDTPLPIKNGDLVLGIENQTYNESIPFKEFITGMIDVIGCSDSFAYNYIYVDILKKLDENIENVILRNGSMLLRGGKYIDALIHFNALLKISPGNMDGMYNRAFTLKQLSLSSREENEKKNYYDMSFEEFKSLAENYPEYPYSHYNLGFYYMDKEEYTCAKMEWDKAHALISDVKERNEIQTLLDIAESSIEFDKCRELITGDGVYEGLKRIIPLKDKYEDWSEVKYYTALAYRKLENYKKAELLLNELIENGEDFSEIFNELGLCYINMGQVRESIDNFKLAVDKEPDNPAYLCNLGMSYSANNDDIKAREYIDKAYNINPNDELTKKCKEWMEKKK